jgi:hypothetical protein
MPESSLFCRRETSGQLKGERFAAWICSAMLVTRLAQPPYAAGRRCFERWRQQVGSSWPTTAAGCAGRMKDWGACVHCLLLCLEWCYQWWTQGVGCNEWECIQMDEAVTTRSSIWCGSLPSVRAHDPAPVTTYRADGGDGLTMGAREVIGVKITIAKKRYPYLQQTRQPNKI